MAQEFLDGAEKAKRPVMMVANVMCLVGEIRKDASQWEKAWELSNHRCARAMRSLGRHRFYDNKFEESIECFHKSFAINRLYQNEWFTCGCAHMRLEQFEKAVFAFGNVVSIDEMNAEAWGNIANCYAIQEKFQEALACSE